MSLFVSRVSLLRLVGILACGAPTLVATGGCHYPSRVGPQPLGALRRFPGVDVASTRNGGFYVRILGGLASEGEPLYIIDGAPLSVDPNHGIDWVKLEDIVEIKALRFPAETAVYGPRGVHGVIIMTTRQGKNFRGRR